VDAGFGYEVGVEVVAYARHGPTRRRRRARSARGSGLSQNADADWLERFESAYTLELQEWIDRS
jgi:hypothetical protein